MEETLSTETVDAAVHELFVRAGQRKPAGGDDYRWAAEGWRRLRDLDTLKEFIRSGE